MIIKMIRKYKTWQRYNNTVRELSRLTNRELNDLGIHRCEIDSVARRSIIKDLTLA